MTTAILDLVGESSVDPHRRAQGERAVLTIATGKDFYWNIAISLARSFERWNSNNDIRFVILTDTERKLPSSLKKTEVLVAAPGRLGQGFSSKLQLDQFAPAKRTLFVDADCLCVGSLEPTFERFAGHAVAVVRQCFAEGEWGGDVKTICTRAGVSALPRFNGGIYYLERGELANQVYEQARTLEPRYDELGMVRLRNRPNDELLMSAAMAKFGCAGIDDDGSVMGDLLATPEVLDLDVIKGVCILRNPGVYSPHHQKGFPVQTIRPIIIHFLGHHVTKAHYRSETVKLLLSVDMGWPDWGASIIGFGIRRCLLIFEDLKSILRPYYRMMFGIRKIRAGSR